MTISTAFQTFLEQAPQHAGAWMQAVQALGQAQALDPKAAALAYLAVLAALRMVSGIPFHVQQAKAAGATRQEVIGALLIGLPAAGNAVIESLPAALLAYDGEPA